MTEDESPHISEHKVIRDGNFRQFYADSAISVRAPKTLELAFLKVESLITNCTVEEGNVLPGEFSMAPSIREVGRATLPISVAVTLAIDILDEISATGILNSKTIEEDLLKIISAAKAAEEEKAERQVDGSS